MQRFYIRAIIYSLIRYYYYYYFILKLLLTIAIAIADCHFGKKVYELEETWHPDLGSPFGVMYCIRCECIAVS